MDADEPAASRLADFEVEFALNDGSGVRRLALAEAGGLPLENAEQIRKFPFKKGQLSFPGWWWLATTGRHVGHESWVERDQLMLLDFDPLVVGVASQPFRLHWRDARGQARGHIPDYFVRMDDGTAVVVDVRPDDRIPESDAEVFAVTARACELAGWGFRRVGVPDAVLTANVRYLSRYRKQDRFADVVIAAALRTVFAAGAPMFSGAERVGERLAVMPVLFHLMWRGELVADLAGGPLSPATVVEVRAGAAGDGAVDTDRVDAADGVEAAQERKVAR